jgi:hypothetical protein
MFDMSQHSIQCIQKIELALLLLLLLTMVIQIPKWIPGPSFCLHVNKLDDEKIRNRDSAELEKPLSNELCKGINKHDYNSFLEWDAIELLNPLSNESIREDVIGGIILNSECDFLRRTIRGGFVLLKIKDSIEVTIRTNEQKIIFYLNNTTQSSIM